MHSTQSRSLLLVLLIAAAGHNRLACEAAVACVQCASIDNQMVCAGGQNFANYCYAQCSGYNQYTFGACGLDPTGQRSGSYDPYNNQYNPYNYQYNPYNYQYDPNNIFNRNGVSNCVCTTEYRLVCAGGMTFSNPCQALCRGYSQYTIGACSQYPNYNRNTYPYYNNGYYYNRNGNNYNAGYCGCPSTASLVCAVSSFSRTRATYLNQCIATCLGARVTRLGNC